MATEFYNQLAHCVSLDEVQQLVARAILPYGYTVSACGCFFAGAKGPAPEFFFQTWPEAWIKLYVDRKFFDVDFGVAEARRRIAPFTWEEAKAERSLSRTEQDLWDTIHQWGWHDGFSVPIHGPGGYLGLVTMGGKPGELTPALRRDLHLMALQVHQRCLAIKGMATVAAVGIPFSRRELECLRWVASGKSDREIGHILGLSAKTVKEYVDSGRVKLGAANRPQAVARLVMAGLL